ncbi:MAG: hypothetical protein JST00_19970 [Deltaproteobacteria bacterium]|nr:hypothetical protein [Deltaproteobacteria bacterium]
MLWRNICLAFAFTALLESPEPQAPIDLSGLTAGPAPSVLEMDPRALAALERRGLSLATLFGSRRPTLDALAETPLYRGVAETLERDIAEIDARPYVGAQPLPHRPFVVGWLRDPRAYFELVGAVHRLDRAFVEPGSCGEARLVYRLALKPEGRPVTRLPMTLNVIFPQRRPAGEGSCASIARAWRDLPTAGQARVDALAAIYRSLPPFTKVETNLQNLHSPALGPDDEDKAEYLLRSFERQGDALVARPLLDTPRVDLGPSEREALARWIREHFAEIDAGAYVIPDAFLATRTVTMAPRGLARPQNRPFARLYGEGEAFADLPYDRAKLVKSPRALVRRLDQGSCTGCHETRAIAGFHLLGDEPDPDARLNAMVVGRSTHLNLELRWRSAMVAETASGKPFDEPRPWAERRAGGPGGPGAHCGLPGETDPVFASWTCTPDQRCRNLHGDTIGQCVPADGNHEGDACQETRPSGPSGDGIVLSSLEECVLAGIRAHECAPTHFGFAGGFCSRPCERVGPTEDPRHVCVDLPASGFEMECMLLRVPIEKCVPAHTLRRRVAGCDATHACRDDYLCARVPGLDVDQGACVPSYFVFQTRVDGPLLDR